MKDGGLECVFAHNSCFFGISGEHTLSRISLTVPAPTMPHVRPTCQNGGRDIVLCQTFSHQNHSGTAQESWQPKRWSSPVWACRLSLPPFWPHLHHIHLTNCILWPEARWRGSEDCCCLETGLAIVHHHPQIVCKWANSRLARHHAINDLIAWAFASAGIPVTKEALNSLLWSDGKQPNGLTFNSMAGRPSSDMGRHGHVPVGRIIRPYGSAGCRHGRWACSRSQDSQVRCAGKSLRFSQLR